jgi:hypothetical protein
MQTQRTVVDGAPTRTSVPVTLPIVPQRSARRATARRASARRATARQRKDHLEERIIEYLKDRPQSTTGDLAKALSAGRGAIAGKVSHIAKAREKQKDGEAT